MIIIRKFFKDIYNKGNFKDYFNRNKLFFIISICLVLLSFYTGFKHTNVNTGFISFLNSTLELDIVSTSQVSSNIVVNFIHNIGYCLNILLLGLSFSILSIIFVVANEVGIGNAANVGSLFAIITDIFVLVGSLLIAKMEVRFILELSTFSWNNIYSRIRVPLKDLILTFTFIVLLILIFSIFGSVLLI